MNAPDPSVVRRGRLCIVGAALLWSLSGAFTKVLTQPTTLGLDVPKLDVLQLACFRGLFAGLVLLPALRPRELTFRPLMLAMVLCFAAMNLLFLAAMSMGTAANAILLQYTAPLWLYLVSVYFLGEKADRRNLTAVLIGVAGIGVILFGGWKQSEMLVVLLGLGSGVTYAGVVLFLRTLREVSSAWLSVLNLLTCAILLLPFVLTMSAPSPKQWLTLALFGSVQMGIPYLLMTRGLRSVNSQEASALTLLEPILNPVWTFLVAGEMPSDWTLLGGVFIVGALLWRYRPEEKQVAKQPTRRKWWK